MKKIQNFSLKGFAVILCSLFFLVVTIPGCGMVVGKGGRYGYDELLAASAVNALADQYIYIDFQQIFPDTYRFDGAKNKVFNTIVRQLKSRGEVITEQNKKKGFIFTAAKEALVPDRKGELDDQDRVYYQLSIYLTPKDSKSTYVTCYPTVLKGDYQEIVLPFARNMLRGIFFGTLAAEFYPKAKKAGLIAAKERKKDKGK